MERQTICIKICYLLVTFQNYLERILIAPQQDPAEDGSDSCSGSWSVRFKASAEAAWLPAILTVPMIVFILPPLFIVLMI